MDHGDETRKEARAKNQIDAYQKTTASGRDVRKCALKGEAMAQRKRSAKPEDHMGIDRHSTRGQRRRCDRRQVPAGET